MEELWGSFFCSFCSTFYAIQNSFDLNLFVLVHRLLNIIMGKVGLLFLEVHEVWKATLTGIEDDCVKRWIIHLSNKTTP